jgi:hypothetical protein
MPAVGAPLHQINSAFSTRRVRMQSSKGKRSINDGGHKIPLPIAGEKMQDKILS